MWFSKKVLYGFLPFLLEWQNFKRLWKGYDDGHDSNRSPEGLWYNWSWYAFANIEYYWFLEEDCKFVLDIIYPTDHFWLI